MLREIRTGEYIATMKAFKDAALVEEKQEEVLEEVNPEEIPQSEEVLPVEPTTEVQDTIEETTSEEHMVTTEEKKDGI